MKNYRYRDGWNIVGIISFVIAVIFFIIGFKCLFSRYDYVAIINSSMATSFFIVSLIFVVISFGCGILHFMTLNSNPIDNSFKDIVDENYDDENKIDTETWICPFCGNLVSTEYNFCNVCGKRK